MYGAGAWGKWPTPKMLSLGWQGFASGQLDSQATEDKWRKTANDDRSFLADLARDLSSFRDLQRSPSFGALARSTVTCVWTAARSTEAIITFAEAIHLLRFWPVLANLVT